MRTLVFCAALAVFVVFASVAAHGDTPMSAPHATIPPADTKAADGEFSDKTLNDYLERVGRLHAFDMYAGKNKALEAVSEGGKLERIGAGYETNVAPESLFLDGFTDGAYTVFEAAVVSVDAYGMRLIVDLSQMAEGEELWVIDPTGPRAFGPYTAADHKEGGCWLPTIEGEMAVLMARSTTGAVPQVGLVAVSHFYREFETAVKELWCNNDIACEANATIQSVSSGVGLMVIPHDTYDSALCSGALINNADTPAFEPYYLTAWHCVPDITGADGVDIIWDYRVPGCNDGSSAPALSSLGRSSGVELLSTSSTYDCTLMELDTVPVGSYGRTYLGWTTQTLSLSADVVCIHHPGGTHMRISYGTLVGLEQAADGFSKQNKVHWDDGVTEGGSSGSPLLLNSAGYQIIGTLSNGPTHSCVDNTGNVDWYSNFRLFYSQVSGWLSGSAPPDPDPPSTGGMCPAGKTFKDVPEVLEQLRALRDNALLQSDLGRILVKAYYQSAPDMAEQVERSPEAKHAFAAITAPLATLGKALQAEQPQEEE